MRSLQPAPRRPLRAALLQASLLTLSTSLTLPLTLPSLLSVSLVACARSGTSPAPVPSESARPEDPLAHLRVLTVDEVDRRLRDKEPNFYVFDANLVEVYEKGHVPTATLVPEGGVTASLLPKDKSATLVFYCANEH